MATLNQDISQPYSLNRNESVDEENPTSGQKDVEEAKQDQNKLNIKKPKNKPKITPRGE